LSAIGCSDDKDTAGGAIKAERAGVLLFYHAQQHRYC